jgi:very-short-patch-repair endonuclease
MASDLETTLAFQLRAAHVAAWCAEHRFAPPRRWRFDFAWPANLVAVEVDGGAWVGGRHTTGSGFHADCEKMSVAASIGWRVLHLDREMVESGRGLELVQLALSWEG